MATLNDYFEMLNIPATSVVSKDRIFVLKKIIP